MVALPIQYMLKGMLNYNQETDTIFPTRIRSRILSADQQRNSVEISCFVITLWCGSLTQIIFMRAPSHRKEHIKVGSMPAKSNHGAMRTQNSEKYS